MAASTKLVLLVLALLLGVSILFYGVMFDGEAGDELDVAEPSVASAPDADRAGDEPANASPRDRPALGAGAGAERPALGASARRPALGGEQASGGARETPAADPGPRPSLGGSARPPLTASRTAPGQIEMGAGRGPLAGGTRLPGAGAGAAAGAAPSGEAGAAPLGRPETARPSLATGAPPADPPARTAPADPPATQPTVRRPAAPPVDPADILVSRYTIRKGDTLSSIAAARLGAARHWPLIRDANPGIDLDRLQVGQRILLPPRASVSSGSAAPSTSEPASPALRPGEQLHEVQAGETLSSIAARRLGAAKHWRLIADRNRDLLGGDPDRLAVGMTLRIPPAPRD